MGGHFVYYGQRNIVAPKGLLCRRVQKSMFVCPFRPFRSGCHEIGYRTGSVTTCELTMKFGGPKTDPFRSQRKRLAFRPVLNYSMWRALITCPNPPTQIVPEGPPMPCGCYLVQNWCSCCLSLSESWYRPEFWLWFVYSIILYMAWLCL